MAIPKVYYRRILGHSGFAKKYGIMVHKGTIDPNYCGIFDVILFNFSNEEYVIERGDRIAQLVIEWYFTLKFVEIREFTKNSTERGGGGFGTTGV